MALPKNAVFFVYVWPEPVSSAAGVRTRALMDALLEGGWGVTAISPSGNSSFRDELELRGIRTATCDPNDSAVSDQAFASLAPSLVVYDRFVMEEQYGWRARHFWPGAFHLVDTQDLHCVRRAREKLVRQGAPPVRIESPTLPDLGEDLLRELSSLYRADAALVVSLWEEAFLAEQLSFPRSRLLCLPFPADPDPEPPGFAARSGFCFLGNFRHPPNLDSVRWLAEDLWPTIRANLPSAELHLYGAYPPQEVSRHQGKAGLWAHGPVRDHREVLRRHKALLAPLRFGAGIKGKVLEAWASGTPTIGTSLTYEGMGWPGPAANDALGLAGLCGRLESDETFWRSQSDLGLSAIESRFRSRALAHSFLSFVEENAAKLSSLREENLWGQILRHQQNNATKYFSRWIEAKNRQA